MPDMDKNTKVISVWGRRTAVGYSGGVIVHDVGWVRVRTADGSCYRYGGTNGYEIQVFAPSIKSFREKVARRGFINPRYWVREEGPQGQETTPEAEYRDANEDR